MSTDRQRFGKAIGAGLLVVLSIALLVAALVWQGPQSGGDRASPAVPFAIPSEQAAAKTHIRRMVRFTEDELPFLKTLESQSQGEGS